MLPDKPVKVAVIGSGGREHALAWKLSQSDLVSHIYCLPGNGGTATLNKAENVDIQVMDFRAIGDFCKTSKVDLVVVGPDDPLARGIVDFLGSRKLRTFGPLQESAKLEWSKAYAKEFMAQSGLPTARYAVANSMEEAKAEIERAPWLKVVKADGLALGKGVFVCDTDDEVNDALKTVFQDRKFGEAGNSVVLEEKLVGEELSLLLLCDGRRLVPMPALQDHKRRFDGDKGPNTGGMGAYSPVALYDKHREAIEADILKVLDEVQSKKLRYTGVLYVGLMIADGRPYVLEFNARFGDPETQTLLPLLESDLLPALWACCSGELDKVKMVWSKKASCCVVAAASGYPESSSKGEEIKIGALTENQILFQAGTKFSGGKVATNGGRVLSVTGLAPDMESAIKEAYQGLKAVDFQGMDYRKDIGARAKKQCLSS